MSRLARTIVLATVATVSGAAVATAATTAKTGEPSVTVFDQAATGNAIKIHYANLPAKGYVAVYAADANGQPNRSSPLGITELNAGDHRDIKVTLKDAPKAGQRMWVGLYKDTDNKPGFDAKADAPIWGTGSLPLENGFVIR